MPPNSTGTASPWSLKARPAARWEVRACDTDRAARLAREAGLSPLLARVFAAREFTCGEDVSDFLSPSLGATHDPFGLKGMGEAVERIGQAIDAGDKIWIYGDYDVDGISATAIAKSAFEFLGVEVETYIPHRLNEGYGLNVGAIDLIHERGGRLIVTVDTGATSHEEIAHAATRGIDVVVTDHHETDGVDSPARALVNPKQPGCEYPFKDLCGAGLAFKLAHALLRKRAPDPDAAREYLKTLMDLLALATVADMVPLRGENRSFVAHGLGLLREASRPGIRSLLEVSGSDPAQMAADRIAFTLGPRINAAGRTEHANYALDLLLSRDPRQARELATLLEGFNKERRRIEAEMTEEAFALIDENEDSPVIIVGEEGWHPGVVGIVASRVLDRYHRPVIAMGLDGDIAKGSARSVGGFDMHGALTACKEHLLSFGGHTMAAGMRLERERLPAFRRALAEHARSVMTEDDLRKTLQIDAAADPEELTDANVSALEAMGPFGLGNPKPLLAFEGFGLVEEPRILKDRHVKLRLAGPDGRDVWAIGFSMAHRAREMGRRSNGLRIAAVPFINTWGGRRRVELELKDVQVED